MGHVPRYLAYVGRPWVKRILIGGVAALACGLWIVGSVGSAGAQSITAPGTTQVQVPAGATSASFVVAGASGGSGLTTIAGGLGGQVTATIPVVPCTSLTVNVGGAGATNTDGAVAAGGINGGGGAPPGTGGGGGTSEVIDASGNRLLVAGGGGGGGQTFPGVGGFFGAGGGGSGGFGSGEGGTGSGGGGGGGSNFAETAASVLSFTSAPTGDGSVSVTFVGASGSCPTAGTGGTGAPSPVTVRPNFTG
jgi:hypothetical protein